MTAVIDCRPCDSTANPGARIDRAAAQGLVEPTFAADAKLSAPVWAPIPARQQAQRGSDGKLVSVATRITGDDHPADTPTSAARVVSVELEPGHEQRIRWAIYAQVSRTDPRAAWRLSGIQVVS